MLMSAGQIIKYCGLPGVWISREGDYYILFHGFIAYSFVDADYVCHAVYD
jgi:hypothetical protein